MLTVKKLIQVVSHVAFGFTTNANECPPSGWRIFLNMTRRTRSRVVSISEISLRKASHCVCVSIAIQN